MSSNPSKYVDKIPELWIKHGGNYAAIAKELGAARSTIQYHVGKLGLNDKPLHGGQITATRIEKRPLPKTGVKRYILSSAQNNTLVWDPLWKNLEALIDYWDAELLCASYSYNINAYGKLSVKNGTYHADSSTDQWFDQRVVPFLDKSDADIEIAPGLVWCGRQNTLPTASRPLSGFETYTGRKSGILPHAQLAMQSIPSGKFEATKFNYTTGTVTQRNYIQKRAGLKAEFHHSYGGLVVEVDTKGRWFVRQLNADSKGRVYDLDLLVDNGKVTTGNSLAGINWGDIHAIRLDPMVNQLAWGAGGMLDTLGPEWQFMNDLLDFRARNHHDRKDPLKQYQLWMDGEDTVEGELGVTAKFLHNSLRDWCTTVVVDSNHDEALLKWLKECEWRQDPQNAEIYHAAWARLLQSIREGDKNFHLVEWALNRTRYNNPEVKFLREDESFIICKDAYGGIECGMHGHLGLGGRGATPQGLARMGRKANTGHTHTAGIFEGMYVAGTSSLLDVGWNVGPSAWSHSHVVTYQNGKRAIVTMWDEKWRA